MVQDEMRMNRASGLSRANPFRSLTYSLKLLSVEGGGCNFLDSNFVDCICINRVISDPKDTRINASNLGKKYWGEIFCIPGRPNLLPNLLRDGDFFDLLFTSTRLTKCCLFKMWYQSYLFSINEVSTLSKKIRLSYNLIGCL